MFSAFGCLVYRYRLIVVAVWAIVVLVAGPIATRVFQVLGADGFSSSELDLGSEVRVLGAEADRRMEWCAAQHG